MFSPETKTAALPRVGKATASLLKKLGLETVHDLLFYFPFRYDDFSRTSRIADLRPGLTASIGGTIELIQNKKSPRRRLFLTEALISDGSDSLKVIWFNQPFLARSYKVGDQLSLAGKVTEAYGQLQMISPLAEKAASGQGLHTSGLVPNYHLTANLGQKVLRRLMKEVISAAGQEPEWLPEGIRQRLGLLGLKDALHQIHFPRSAAEVRAAQKRLSFEELFLRQLKSQMIKRSLQARTAPAIAFREKETRAFVASLPFALTEDQRRTAWEILNDLEKTSPMSRLLEGDVGSGKTLVVVIALLNTALNGQQALLMAPTEILARQHYATINGYLSEYKLKIALATGSRKDQGFKQADIIIGTHALIQKKAIFKRLALAVVDEQHRFGVSQRQHVLEANREDRLTPHFLSLTATPIPRSLALAIYGDLKVSLIQQKPAGRKEIITRLVKDEKRAAAYDFVRREIASGRQAFVICPLIDPSDKLGVKSVKEEHARLEREVFPDIKIGLLHGKLKNKEKEKIMEDFLNQRIQILVATTVVEVGIDVPNATIMLIEGAERFGLAQLHQFRGRVGRAGHQSYCLLFPSQEEIANPVTQERLEAMTKYNDGFSLAKIDLKLRGAGELYGTGQSGFPELQIASLFDAENISQAQNEAARLIAADPTLNDHPLMRERLGRWEEHVHLE